MSDSEWHAAIEKLCACEPSNPYDLASPLVQDWWSRWVKAALAAGRCRVVSCGDHTAALMVGRLADTLLCLECRTVQRVSKELP